MSGSQGCEKRARELGGSLDIQSESTRTKVVVKIPFVEEASTDSTRKAYLAGVFLRHSYVIMRVTDGKAKKETDSLKGWQQIATFLRSAPLGGPTVAKSGMPVTREGRNV